VNRQDHQIEQVTYSDPIDDDSPRAACAVCGVPDRFKGWRAVVLRDRPFGDRTAALHWHKRRWRCEDVDCASVRRTEQDDRIAHSRMKLTRRAALRATEDVGRKGRTVNEVAEELGCDWHTVVAYGEALVDHSDRFAEVTAVGLDETAHRLRHLDRRRDPGPTPGPRPRARRR
jgi:transposase